MTPLPGWVKWPFRKVERFLAENLRDAISDDETVVRTTRYLRLAMIGLVLGLAAALLFELIRARNISHNWCLLGSISAYYYTPVHAFFVGALVTIGVALVAIRGNTTVEDMLLNFAGIFAPFVALVPTDHAPTECHAILDTTDRDLEIANNVGALFVLVGAGLLVLGILGVLGYLGIGRHERPTLAGLVAYLVVVCFAVTALILFLAGRTWFKEFAHPISAITMFALLGVNALLNGYNLYETRKHQDPAVTQKREVPHFNTYTAIGTVMLVAAIAFPTLVRPHWHQWVFGLEATEIGLFAAFWVRQTIELWHEGLRTAPS